MFDGSNTKDVSKPSCTVQWKDFRIHQRIRQLCFGLFVFSRNNFPSYNDPEGVRNNLISHNNLRINVHVYYFILFLSDGWVVQID